jgi:hypothetical protein
MIYLGVFSFFLYGNNIESWKAIIIFLLYFVHILLMKFNYIYEMSIKKTVARNIELKALKKQADKDISSFHKNPERKGIKSEDLANIRYSIEDDGRYLSIDANNRVYSKQKVW